MRKLVEYTWCHLTGLAELVYEVRHSTGETVTEKVKKAQPAHPQHVGWYISLAHWLRKRN